MHIDAYIVTFSALMVGMTLAMGFWSARKSKTAADFFVAGRSVGVGWNASAISGEYLSAASFMGVAGMVMSSGYDALWYPVCYACGYLFLLLFIAGPLRRFGAYTIPDFAEGRFDSPLFRKIAVCFVLFIGFFYTMPQMKGAGTTLAYIFPGLPYWAGVAVVGAVITLNVSLGGMKGITLVQAFQYWAKMFAISVPIFILMAVYGDYGTHLGANRTSATTNIKASSDEELRVFKHQEISFEPDTSVKTSLEKLVGMDKWSYGSNGVSLTVEEAISTLAQAKFAKQGRWTQYIGGDVVTNTFYWNPPLQTSRRQQSFLISVLASNGITLEEPVSSVFKIYPTIDKAKFESLVLPEQVSQLSQRPLPEKAPKDESWISPFGPLTTKAAKAAHLPADQTRLFSLIYTYSLIIALVCGTAGLPHILVRFYTNPDGVAAKRTTMWVMILIGVFYVFPPVFGVMGRNLMPDLYNGLAGVKGTDGVVLKLPKLLNDKWPPLGSILSGITCAGAFAAFMSTFSGLLVSMTGALAHDVYGRILRPKSTPEQRMRMFKVCAILCGIGAVLLGLLVETFEINKMVGWAFAIAATSYFPLLFLSTWWRGMTMKGAATGMLCGGLLSVSTVVSTMLADQAGWAKPLSDFFAVHPLLRILAEQPAIWALPLAIGLMIVVSMLTSREVPTDIRMKMLVLHAPEKLGLKQEYIHEAEVGH
jgi:cation/acetate symporter